MQRCSQTIKVSSSLTFEFPGVTFGQNFLISSSHSVCSFGSNFIVSLWNTKQKKPPYVDNFKKKIWKLKQNQHQQNKILGKRFPLTLCSNSKLSCLRHLFDTAWLLSVRTASRTFMLKHSTTSDLGNKRACVLLSCLKASHITLNEHQLQIRIKLQFISKCSTKSTNNCFKKPFNFMVPWNL